MNAVRRIADQCQTRPNEITRDRETERECTRLAFRLDLAEPTTEALFELDLEQEVVVQQPLRVRRCLRPHER